MRTFVCLCVCGERKEVLSRELLIYWSSLNFVRPSFYSKSLQLSSYVVQFLSRNIGRYLHSCQKALWTSHKKLGITSADQLKSCGVSSKSVKKILSLKSKETWFFFLENIALQVTGWCSSHENNSYLLGSHHFTNVM